MNIKIYILFIVTAFASLISYGQDYNKYCLYANYAEKAYGQGDFEGAIFLMDSSITNCPESNSTATNWYNLSIFYKSLYKKNKEYALITKMLSSALKAKELDKENELSKPINSAIKNIAILYQKEASKILNDTAKDPSLAMPPYLKYKEIYKIAYPNKNFKSEDINIYNVIGDVYKIKYYNSSELNKNYIDSAILYFNNSLKLDSNQINVFTGIGIVYFNQAVNVINSLDTEADFEMVMRADNIKADYAIKGLPYFLKALELDPNNSKILYSLAGCYNILQMTEEYEFYYKMLEEKDPEYFNEMNSN